VDILTPQCLWEDFVQIEYLFPALTVGGAFGSEQINFLGKYSHIPPEFDDVSILAAFLETSFKYFFCYF
jgi:hypothetical protein